MKNTFAKKLAAAAVALTVAAAPAIAIAQPAVVKATPASVTYQFRMDDLPFGYQFHDEALMPAAYARAIDAALADAGLTWREVEIDDVYVFVSPAYGEPIVEVEFEAYGLDFDYLIGLNTLNVYAVYVD